MKKIIIVSVFFLFSFEVRSQFLNNTWVLGLGPPENNTIINFNNGIGTPVVATLSSQDAFYVTNASISNMNGNLLFYTNGFNIYDNTNSIMMNGGGLSPDNAPGGPYNDFIWQGCLILPVPDHANLYYLFHQTYNFYADGVSDLQPNILYMSTIDINQSGGLGTVINKNYHLYEDTITQGRLTACKHANGRDWWLISHEWNNTTYLRWLITPDSIHGPYSQNVGSVILYDGYGQACFSPDGSKYANFFGGTPDKRLDILKFDRCTGLFDSCQTTNIIDTTIYTQAFGCGFSQSSEFLYVTTGFHLFQFNTDASNIISTKTTVAYYDGFIDGVFNITFFGPMQIAPDNKIYFNAGATHYLHYIAHPDSAGIACNVIQHGLQLPNQNLFNIPNHPNYSLDKLTGSLCDTLTIIQEVTKHDLKLRVFPNPVTKGQLKIIYLLPQNKSGLFEMFDINGRKVYSLRLPQWSTLQIIDLPELSDGLYSCVITSNSNRASKKISLIKE